VGVQSSVDEFIGEEVGEEEKLVGMRRWALCTA